MRTKPSKYRSVRTTVDGVTFHSKAEARRYSELKILEKAGAISGLELQPRFPLMAPGSGHSYERTHLGDYVADFLYRIDGECVVEDVKGMRTPLYKWKKKHFEAQHGVPITEVTR